MRCKKCALDGKLISNGLGTGICDRCGFTTSNAFPIDDKYMDYTKETTPLPNEDLDQPVPDNVGALGPEALPKTDMVNHPPHYTNHPSGVECIQITEHMGFNLGNALKYIWRADEKWDAIEDLKKAEYYLKREIAKRKALLDVV